MSALAGAGFWISEPRLLGCISIIIETGELSIGVTGDDSVRGVDGTAGTLLDIVIINGVMMFKRLRERLSRGMACEGFVSLTYCSLPQNSEDISSPYMLNHLGLPAVHAVDEKRVRAPISI